MERLHGLWERSAERPGGWGGGELGPRDTGQVHLAADSRVEGALREGLRARQARALRLHTVSQGPVCPGCWARAGGGPRATSLPAELSTKGA